MTLKEHETIENSGIRTDWFLSQKVVTKQIRHITFPALGRVFFQQPD
jgi:hypothetical protein